MLTYRVLAGSSPLSWTILIKLMFKQGCHGYPWQMERSTLRLMQLISPAKWQTKTGGVQVVLCVCITKRDVTGERPLSETRLVEVKQEVGEETRGEGFLRMSLNVDGKVLVEREELSMWVIARVMVGAAVCRTASGMGSSGRVVGRLHFKSFCCALDLWAGSCNFRCVEWGKTVTCEVKGEGKTGFWRRGVCAYPFVLLILL